MTDLDADIVSYLVGDSGETGVRALENHLRTDPAARARFVELCQQDLALRQVLQENQWEDASVAAGRPVTEAYTRSSLAPRRPGTARHARRSDRQTRRRRAGPSPLLPALGFAAATGLLLAILLVWTSQAPGPVPDPEADRIARPATDLGPQQPAPVVAQVTVGSGTVDGAALAVGDPLRFGQAVATADESLHLRCAGDGSLLRLPPRSRAAIRSDGTGVEVELLSGYAYVEVAEQDEGRTFRIITPHGRIEALGTVIIAHCDIRHTVAAVMEGRIAVITADGARRELSRGHHLRLAIGGFTSDTDRPVAFTLVHGGSGLPLAGQEDLRDAATVSAAELDEHGLNALVDLPDAATSMRTWLDGAEGPVKLEQHWPFFAFGNTLDRIHGRHLEPGEHELRVVLYRDLQGTVPLDIEARLRLTVTE